MLNTMSIRKTNSEASIRASVLACIKKLRHATNLADVAASSREPERGAEYLLIAVSDLRRDLATLRTSLNRRG